MTAERTPIDIRQPHDLAQLAEDVRATRQPRRLVRGEEDVAILIPAPMPATRAPRAARRPSGVSFADRTAGIFKASIPQPSVTPAAEKAAFEQAVADQVVESLGR